VPEEPFLAGLVIIGGDLEHPGHALDGVSATGQLDRLGGRVGAGPGEDGHLAAGLGRDAADDLGVLLVVERGGLAGRADGDEAVDARVELGADEALKVVIGDLAVAHRCDERGVDAVKLGCVHHRVK
jgi:hypothetical protein